MLIGRGSAFPTLTRHGRVREAERMPLKTPDQCLEASVDYWALGQLAQETGREDEALWWTQRGEQVFDSVWTKEFMIIDSTYTRMRGNGLYQGTRWQYRWGAPMYLKRMEQLVGSKVLLAQLEQFFQEGNKPWTVRYRTIEGIRHRTCC